MRRTDREGNDAHQTQLSSYFQTQPEISPVQVAAYEQQANKQNAFILRYLREIQPEVATAEDILARGILPPNTPITSIRRALTNLNHRGQIMKAGTVNGQYGRPINTYRASPSPADEPSTTTAHKGGPS